MRHFVLMMPYPISTNALYAGKERRYKSKAYKLWIDEAYLMLLKQDLQFFSRRVDLIIHVGGGRKDADISNMIKGVEDMLVRQKIIHDDSRDYVRSVKCIWDRSVVGCMVEIEEVE